jgi:hypothetical protein
LRAVIVKERARLGGDVFASHAFDGINDNGDGSCDRVGGKGGGIYGGVGDGVASKRLTASLDAGVGEYSHGDVEMQHVGDVRGTRNVGAVISAHGPIWARQQPRPPPQQRLFSAQRVRNVVGDLAPSAVAFTTAALQAEATPIAGRHPLTTSTSVADKQRRTQITRPRTAGSMRARNF